LTLFSHTCTVTLVLLAWKYHPDTSPSGKLDQKAFHDVTEAWAVLSRPELKSLYDSRRTKYLMKDAIPSFENQELTLDFSFKQSAKQNTNDSWKDRQDKYKTSNWRKLSHHEQKVQQKSKSTLLTQFISASCY
jgi:DnaJ-class molecular chaperone